MPGFIRGRNLEKLGLKYSDTAELFFEDVVVPVENQLGEEGKAFSYLAANLAQERTSISVGAVAMSAVCFAAVKFSHLATLQHFLARAAWLIGIIVVSVGIYFGLAWALRCEELPELFLLLRRAQPTAATSSLDVA